MAAKQTAFNPRTTATGKPLVYTSGGVDAQPIPGGALVRSIKLNLVGTLTTSANLAAAAIAAGAAWGIVKKIRILSGTEELYSFTGEELRWVNAHNFRAFPRGWLTLGSTTTTVNQTLTLPLMDGRTMRAMDTALNAGLYGQLRIEVTWGTFTDIASTGTVFTGNIYWSYDFVTPGADTPSDQLKTLEVRTQRLQLTNVLAQNDFQIPLPVGFNAIRWMMIYAKDSSGNDQPGKIDVVKLRSVNTLILEENFTAMRDDAYQRSGLREQCVSGAKASPFQDAQADFDNWLYLDPVRDRRLSEAFSTFALPELKLSINVNATITNLYVLTKYILPPRG